MHPTSSLKATYRKKILQQSKDTVILSVEDATNIITTGIFDNSQSISAYWPLKPEVDITNLLHILHNDHRKSIFIPKPLTTKVLSFIKWTPDTKMIFENGCFVPECKTIFSINDIDTVIVPCIGVDANYQRLGRGGGFYDRSIPADKPTLSFINQNQFISEAICDPHDLFIKTLFVFNNTWKKLTI